MSHYTQKLKNEKLQMVKVRARKWKSREKQKRRRLNRQARSISALRILMHQYPALLDQNVRWIALVLQVFGSLPGCRPEVQIQIIDQIRRSIQPVQSMISNLQPGVTTVVTDWRDIPEITRTQHMADFFKSWTPDQLLEFVQLCKQLPSSWVCTHIWGKTDIQLDSHLDLKPIMDLCAVERVMTS